MLLHEIIELAASTCGDQVALVADGRRLTFGELEARIRHMSARIAELTDPGDRVVLVAENRLDAVTALYAVPRAGAQYAPANVRHTPEEIRDFIESIAPAVVLATPGQLDRVASQLEGLERAPEVLSIDGEHATAKLDLTAALDDDAASGVPEEHHHVSTDQRVCAWIIHTSGTTGRPRAAMLTHGSLSAAVLNTAIARPMAADDVYLFPFPLFHVAAYNVLHAHLRRRPVVLIPRFEPEAFMRAVRDEGITTCSLAPTMLSILLDHPEFSPEALRGLRQISYGASSMPRALLHRVLDELPEVGLAQGYGMTELSGNAVFLGPDEHRRAATDAPHLLDAAGRPGPLTALRIEDEDGNEVPRGEVGEILVRGEQVVPGYWQDPVATSEARSGHWLRTGDVGRIDDEGYLHVIDRKKDIIVTGGENVASREVENVMCTHPGVSQVAVVGVPDPKWGEAVCAVVVASPEAEDLDPDELIRWTEGRLAGYKRPKQVVVLREMPANASGKVDKRRVRELLGDTIDLRGVAGVEGVSAARGR